MPTIFVVDPDPQTPDSFAERLRREGYHVLSMRDPEEAVESLRCIRANLIVVDVRSRAMGRPAVVASLRNSRAYQALPVLIVGAGYAAGRRIQDSDSDSQTIVAEGPGGDDVIEHVRQCLAPLCEPYN